MKYLFAAVCGLMLVSCNGNNSGQEAAATQADSTTSAEKTPEVEQVAVTPQDKPAEGQYCFIEKVYEKEGVAYIDADYIQFLMGKAAVTAARKKGDAEPLVRNGDTTWSVPNDYYILNENRKIRTLALQPGFRLVTVKQPGDVPGVEYLKKYAKDAVFILTLDAADSTVTQIKEQYLP
ncbi:hypothetical protein HNQ91_000219 [Filimonas zeae]|uniref:Lipoprotein n=1 Tax=Filimonas zeae TaxID=1737353 RepID=A0A917INX7_9BACT|nr:hypothetical protein [Filimonas zeae]MDR6337197.1 hypothetical protein [Filimonas zeae]GGH57448.1 hypothetical protein GCM10011379_02150 [Filimonas zeae]